MIRNKLLTAIVLLLISATSFSADSSSTSSTTTTPSETSASTSVVAPAPPAISTPEASKPPADRKDSQSNASAMAAMGAAMAGLSCTMMMQQASKMPPGKDKDMMMMMAMQQCAQAAQSAANAAQNKDGAKKLTQDDIPKQAQLGTPTPLKIPESKEDNSALNELQKDSDSPSDTPTPSPSENLPTIAAADPIDLKPKQTTGEPAAVNQTPVGEAQSWSKLTPLERAEQGYDDKNKNNNPTPNPATLPSTFSFASSKGFSGDELKKLVGVDTTLEGKSKRNGSGGGDESNALSSSGTSESSPETKNESPFDSMLSQLMGGGASPAMDGGGQAGQDFVNLPSNAKGEAKVNIFQYASFRYQYSAYNENKIRLRATKPVAVSRTLAEMH